MRNSIAICAIAWLLMATSTLTIRGDEVIEWNNAALNVIRAERISPPKATRTLAILHTAIYDAVNGIRQSHEPYFVTGKAPGVASPAVAASTAAHEVLMHLHPGQKEMLDALYDATIKNQPAGPAKDMGIAWGREVAAGILRWRSTDGSSTVVDYFPGTGPGQWRPTPPAFAPALLPQWGKVIPFGTTNLTPFLPPPPPTLSSPDYAVDLELTRVLGAATSTARTVEQTEIALFWSDGAGTVTPPGHWNQIAQNVAASQSNSLAENARLFALLNIALADAAILSWECKYSFNFWRPVTALRDADADGNPATVSDPAWASLLVTPPFPEYTSGHSTFSGSAAAILTGFFETDQIDFITSSDGLPGVTRTFHRFSDAAAEAGMSRIYGGIHFMSANRNGLLSGAALGGYVNEQLLRPKPGNSRRGLK